MKIEDLEKNDVVLALVNNIISDKTFKSKCEMNFKQIFEDGKVDTDDIPIIINLILTIYNNHNKIKVSKVNMKPVFMLLISKLLQEFKGDIMLDESLILLMLEPQIDLLLMSVGTISDLKLPCCGSRPTEEDEGNTMNKMRLNKMEKQKKADAPVTVEETLPMTVEEILPSITEEILPKKTTAEEI